MSKAPKTLEADPARPSVGYGKPPTRTRFKKGRSGNRKGRPTGSKNYCVVLEHVLKECVKLPDGRAVSKAEALVIRAQHGALKGDPGRLRSSTCSRKSSNSQSLAKTVKVESTDIWLFRESCHATSGKRSRHVLSNTTWSQIRGSKDPRR